MSVAHKRQGAPDGCVYTPSTKRGTECFMWTAECIVHQQWFSRNASRSLLVVGVGGRRVAVAVGRGGVAVCFAVRCLRPLSEPTSRRLVLRCRLVLCAVRVAVLHGGRDQSFCWRGSRHGLAAAGAMRRRPVRRPSCCRPLLLGPTPELRKRCRHALVCGGGSTLGGSTLVHTRVCTRVCGGVFGGASIGRGLPGLRTRLGRRHRRCRRQLLRLDLRSRCS
mmetsp:Transcript_27440/g.91261  ORF Transcript_27440/g.91261 Transcript_27440/m.91261 type:complete len:221 (-) Transcript_27440:58-720(-)